MHRARNIVMAVGTQPDDIEFRMAGTLVLLGQAGWHLHYFNLANGSCCRPKLPHDRTVALRDQESRKAAKFIMAVYHAPLVDDAQIFFEPKLLARVAAVVREVNPAILLLPSPYDYREEHANTSRLAVTAALYRGFSRFATTPAVDPVLDDMAVYHAMPNGLRDAMRRRVVPGLFINITPVIDNKREMLAMHHSQQEWYDAKRGKEAYVTAMEDMALEVGRVSKKYKYAEGWHRRLYRGLAEEGNHDPLSKALAPLSMVNARYERRLEQPR
ncbi:MAG: PIG-L family deacetylase [Planctomycetota bacterium]